MPCCFIDVAVSSCQEDKAPKQPNTYSGVCGACLSDSSVVQNSLRYWVELLCGPDIIKEPKQRNTYLVVWVVFVGSEIIKAPTLLRIPKH